MLAWIRMEKSQYEEILAFLQEVKVFFSELTSFLLTTFHLQFLKFEAGKGKFVTSLYRQRGKMARRLVHSGMAALSALGIIIAPAVAQEFPGQSIDPWSVGSAPTVLSASTSNQDLATTVSEKVRSEVILYDVTEGDTLSVIAEKFGVSEDTIRWQNDLQSKDSIKVGQTLEILPVTGISHTVKKGETVHSIAKKYDTSAQAIVDFPYNTFTNDETFALAVGQTVIVPDGIMPSSTPWSATARVRQITPDAGSVTASGRFVWPTAGSITQNFAWYHTGIDIANRAAPGVLAADSGRVVTAGWPDGWGYGNRVVIDHGNGYRTRYAHLSAIYVTVGQTVNRGDLIGKMGSTGRSTGTHLHFEVMQNGVFLNPLGVLQ